jgi:DNA-binding response OmpR family regulator
MKDILIVEDGRQERTRLDKLFSDAGYRVVACESVTAAEQVLGRERFRLAVLDIGLGDKSGSLLFNKIQQNGAANYTIIFTGNPSVHLKQRFLDEGAADYIVKASPAARNDSFLSRVQELIGESAAEGPSGMALEDFLQYVSEKSRQLFLDVDDRLPPCGSCSSREYVVDFGSAAQMPPEVVGSVRCSNCGQEMDPEIA